MGVAPEKAIKLTVNDMLRDAFTDRDPTFDIKVAVMKQSESLPLHLEILAGKGLSMKGLLVGF